MVGFSAAVPRGPLWFVCELRVDPEQRNQGIGRRLLSRARRSVRGIRGRILAGLAGPDPAGLALGVGAGMMPRCAIVRLHGDAAAARKLWRAHAPGRGSRVVRYDPDAPLGPRSPLAALDRAARGAARPQDHRFWLAAAERRGMLVWHGKRPVAYLYVGHDGGPSRPSLGPVPLSC